MAPKSRRSKANATENALGLQGRVTTDMAHALDFFQNVAARTGWGTSSLENQSRYELQRWSLNYYDVFSIYEESWIARRIVDTPAQDMMRIFPTINTELPPQDLDRIYKAIRRTRTKSQMLESIIWGRLFGGAGALIAIDGQEKQLEEPLDLDTIELHSYRGLIPFDRWSGITPSGDVCTDINRPIDFGNPEFYDVRAKGGQSFRVHCSRIIRFTGPILPEPERSAHSGWGISVLAPVVQTVQAFDNVNANALSLSFRANILGMKMPDLAQLLSGLGSNSKATQGFEARMQRLNEMMSNQSLVLLPENGELSSTQYSFSGLAELLQNFQLQISAAAKMPHTRLWGKTATGLSDSGEGDERRYAEDVATDADTTVRPALEKLLPIIAMSELGEVPDDMELNFPNLTVPTEQEKSELGKSVTDTVIVALNSGLISPRTAGKELKQASDKTGVFTNITDEDIEKLSNELSSEGELGEGLFGEAGGGLEPTSGPAKVVREENAMAKQEPKPPLEHAQATDADGPARKTYQVHGLDVIIETPKGCVRAGPWGSKVLPYDYGYLPGHDGADGDSLDAVVGPDHTSKWVYVFDQRRLPPGKGFDESKCFLGYASQADALAAFNAGHDRANEVMMDWTPMRMTDFKRWLRTRDHRQPCSPDVRA